MMLRCAIDSFNRFKDAIRRETRYAECGVGFSDKVPWRHPWTRFQIRDPGLGGVLLGRGEIVDEGYRREIQIFFF